MTFMLFFNLLTILFVGLKLTGFIAWPWLCILAPTWIPTLVMVAVIAWGCWLTLKEK